jgi:hypothetical protein
MPPTAVSELSPLYCVLDSTQTPFSASFLIHVTSFSRLSNDALSIAKKTIMYGDKEQKDVGKELQWPNFM